MDPSLYNATPLWESRPLSSILGVPVFLKMESFQPAGSFKSRGMGAACQAARNAGATHVVCASGGNAGYAVAYAGRVLGMRATIVVPQTTSPRSQELIRGEGAELIVHGEAWDDSNTFAMALAERAHAAYIHPFDDPRAWSGHATMVHEIAQAGVKPGIVVVAVGGGGLLCGLLQGMHEVGWNDVPVLAVETEGAASFAKSVQAGQLVTLDRIATVATTLGARRVAQRAFDWTREHSVTPWVVNDRAAVEACLQFADDHRVLVEPACGAALAAAYHRAEPLQNRAPIVIVVCGGAGVTRELLDKWNKQVN